jgi:lipopolysaccharide/colanic/teichoic acid biosynthesis glycosyltransferase
VTHIEDPKEALRILGVRRFQRLFQRALDFVGSGVLIVVLSPLFVVIAVLAQVVDGSPDIYHRRVVGVVGASFDAYKLGRCVERQKQFWRPLLTYEKLIPSTST